MSSPLLNLLLWSVVLRAWQDRFFDDYLRRDLLDYLLVAWPGTGKTIAALRVAHHLLKTGRIRRIVVVVPSDNLREQWATKAAEVGIQLDPNWQNADGVENSADYHGIVVTYAAVARNPDLYRKQCSVPTFVVLDEIHHAGDENSWGEALLVAFEAACRRLLLSGTPFRQGGGRIPFVCYDENDTSVAQFSYGYGPGLEAGDLRLVLFPHYEGKQKWYVDGKEWEKDFSENVSQRNAAYRLRTALLPQGQWLHDTIGEADKKLEDIRRNGHPNAGGLITCIDMAHARAIARLVYHLTGEQPVLVISDDADAKAKLRAYASSSSKWLVAVKLVTEGVDIPRLRVGVYATNVLTELFFRQFVGRFVRTVEGLEEQTAYVYIPADAELISFAQKIKEERDHVLEQEEEDENGGKENGGGGGGPGLSDFTPLRSGAAQFQGTIHDEDVYSPEELTSAKVFVPTIGLSARLSDADSVKILRFCRKAGSAANAERPSRSAGKAAGGPDRPVYEQKKEAAHALDKLCKKLAYAFQKQRPDADYGETVRLINGKLCGMMDKERSQCSVEELKRERETVAKWMKGFSEAVKKGMAALWLEQWELS